MATLPFGASQDWTVIGHRPGEPAESQQAIGTQSLWPQHQCGYAQTSQQGAVLADSLQRAFSEAES